MCEGADRRRVQMNDLKSQRFVSVNVWLDLYILGF